MISLTSIQVSESSVTEPVTLDELKAWMKVDFPDDDDVITGMGIGARQSVEGLLNLALVTKTIQLDVEVTGDCEKKVTMPYTSGMSAITVDELDDNDETTTLASGTDYFVRGNIIRLNPGRYHVSYTTVPGTIPEAIKEAIKMEVAERYANRGENVSGLSEGAKAKAMPYQVIWI